MSLQVKVEHASPGCIVVRPEGEVRLAAVKDFEQELLRAIQSKPAGLLVDLKGVTSISSAGIGVLASCVCGFFAGMDTQIVVTGAQGSVLEAIRLTGLMNLGRFCDSEAEALRLLASSPGSSAGSAIDRNPAKS